MMLPVWTVGYSRSAVLNRQYVHTQRRSYNDVASMDSWLLSKNNTHQTIRTHTEKEFLREIAADRHIVARIV